MNLSSSGITNDWFDKKYGAHGCGCSPPLKITGAPEGTVSFALLFEDRDAFPVTGGFSWVHWTACNLRFPELPEGVSPDDANIAQGVNSYISPQGGSRARGDCTGYCSMSPPGEAHLYTFHVYALDTVLELESGFDMHRMFRAMRGHVLDSAELSAWYPRV